ncbi:class I SAM-dependent methyltransferase [Candidatus Woesearchaeota archaeon]|nr:class I SAM-dependent methyltransferase [Candidatus Woesearchaeota archaeon]
MILNKLEFILMNNPVRRWIQNKIEVKELHRVSSLQKNKVILEIGCGSGNGTRLIKKYFSPKKIYAIDLDPRMINLAKKNVRDPSITFEVASATKLPYHNSQFDAVVDFAIIHHIPNWKDCLEELKRVLKPNGELIVEDLSIETFSTAIGRIYKKVLTHPYAQMYTEKEFIEYLQKIGFTITHHRSHHSFHLIKYFNVIAKKK